MIGKSSIRLAAVGSVSAAFVLVLATSPATASPAPAGVPASNTVALATSAAKPGCFRGDFCVWVNKNFVNYYWSNSRPDLRTPGNSSDWGRHRFGRWGTLEENDESWVNRSKYGNWVGIYPLPHYQQAMDEDIIGWCARPQVAWSYPHAHSWQYNWSASHKWMKKSNNCPIGRQRA